MLSDRDQIEEIKRKLDIASVVQEYVPTLKRKGRNYFGLCPFHRENTASFSVNDELGIYKCFGCGESGDLINFIEKIEGVEFIKALELLAKKAGVELKRTYTSEQQKHRQERERLLEANRLAAEYFHYILFKHQAGEAGREYVKKRNLRKLELKQFKIGFAPEGFNNLKEFLKKKGYKEKELVKWGLLVDKNGHAYDKFRSRIMFPIFNHVGDVVGFSGRVVNKDDIPKYLNSPETPVYKKSENVYGLYQAKDEMRKNNFVIMVEGNIDILSAHAIGVGNIIAPLGTALTKEQLQLVKRYVDEIYFAFDTDAAGEKALLRALEMAEQQNMKTKALNLAKFQDVDDLINNGGNFKEVIKNAQPIVDHLMERFKAKFNTETPRGKDQYIKELLPYIAKIDSPVEKGAYLQRLAEEQRIELEVLKGMLASPSSRQKHIVGQTKPVAVPFKTLPEFGILSLVCAHEKFLPKISKEEFSGLELQPESARLLEDLLNGKKPQTELYKTLKLVNEEVFTEVEKFKQELSFRVNRMIRDDLRKKLKNINYAGDDRPNDRVILIAKLAAAEKKLVRRPI